MSIKWMDNANTIKTNRQPVLVGRYVHSGNPVVQPTSLDLTTGIFTSSTPLSIPSGTYQSASPVASHFNNGIIPRELTALNGYDIYPSGNGSQFYLASGNSSSYLITSYPNANNTGVDPTQFYFEYNTLNNVTLDITGLGLTNIRVKFHGFRNRVGWSYIYPHHIGDGVAVTGENLGTFQDGRSWQAIELSLIMRYNKETGLYLSYIEDCIEIEFDNSSGSWTTHYNNTNNGARIYHRYKDCELTGVQFSFSALNGNVYEVWDLGDDM